jgi:hypothetical protein
LEKGEVLRASITIATGALTIRVVDQDTHSPIAGAVISQMFVERSATTDNDGLAVLRGYSRSVNQLDICAKGYGPAITAFGPGEAQRAIRNVALSPSGRLLVQVINPERAPQESVTVVVSVMGRYICADPLPDLASNTPIVGHGEKSWRKETGPDGCARFLDLPASVPMSISVLAPSTLGVLAGKDCNLESRVEAFVEIVIDRANGDK